MPQPFLSRGALAHVLRSLLVAELRTARGRRSPDAAAAGIAPEAISLGPDGFGCDSLDLLWLAAATNEMFHLHETGVEADLLSSAVFERWLDGIEQAWRAGVKQVTFTTSGSTGRPKRCVQTAGHLGTEVEALAERWRGRRRVVALAPAHHIYGFLFTAMLPDRLGVPCLDAGRLGVADLLAALQPGDLVVSFPERWSFLERSIPAWPADVAGVVSTGPCPQAVLAGLAERGLARMTEVYGSSETAGIAWRDESSELYRLMPHWRFAEPHDDAAPTLIHRDGSRHPLMDQLSRIGPDGLALGGRRDGMVQVGGINVAPAAVAARLRQCPGVRWAMVRLMRPDEGGRLKALLGIDAGLDAEVVRAEVAAWAAAHLVPAERPVSIASSASEAQPAKNFDW